MVQGFGFRVLGSLNGSVMGFLLRVLEASGQGCLLRVLWGSITGFLLRVLVRA